MDEPKRKVLKRRNFGVKTKRLVVQNKSNRSLSLSGNNDKSVVHKKNKVLAMYLNDARTQNAALCTKINSLNGEILELRRENAELRTEKQRITTTARATEAELQMKVDMNVNIKNNVTKAFDCLAATLRCLESSQNRSHLNQSRLREELNSSWFQRTSTLRDTPQATVSPRVSGHEIRKPKIRIARLNMSDIDVNVPVNLSVPDQNNTDPSPSINEPPEVTEEEEEPLMIHTRRRPPTRPNPSGLDTLEENTDEERNEEYILLYPRVILDRIRVTPSRPSSAASRRQSSTVNLEESETPRSRESFDDFARTLSGIDPMEGPSWLFEEESSAQTTTKTRDEKRKENSLKARFSSASRRLSVETEEEQPSEVVPSEQEQPPEPPLQPPPPAEEEPRRRGSRAAAAAARSSLKEPTLNSKLRQGDPSSTSVYEDFVPGTKRKSSSEPKSSKSAKSSDASKSKSKRKNSNDKDEKNTK